MRSIHCAARCSNRISVRVEGTALDAAARCAQGEIKVQLSMDQILEEAPPPAVNIIRERKEQRGTQRLQTVRDNDCHVDAVREVGFQGAFRFKSQCQTGDPFLIISRPCVHGTGVAELLPYLLLTER